MTENPWGVLFDVDGVLIDSYNAHLVSWQRTLARHGHDMTAGLFAITFGRTNADIFREFFPAIAESDYAALDEEKEADYRELIVETFPEMNGADDLLAALDAAGARIAVGSSAPPENVAVVIDALPHGSCIQATVHGREVRRGKPDPQVYELAARRIDLPPSRCIVVEDAVPGVGAGQAAGAKVVALTGTASREDLADADLVVDSLRELTPTRLRELL